MSSIHLRAAVVVALVLAASGASAQAQTFQQNPVTYVDQLQIISGVATYPGSSGVSSCVPNARSQRVVITFTPAFDTASRPPSFTAAISFFDVDHTTNARMAVNVVSVTPTEATVDVVTWCDTNLYMVRVSYMAMGYRQL